MKSLDRRDVGRIALARATGALLLLLVMAGACAVPPASAGVAADTATVLIAFERADDATATRAPSAEQRDAVTAALARAFRVRIATADTAWVTTRASASEEGVRWTPAPRRDDAVERPALVPWADVVAVDVRGVDRVGPAFSGGVIGLLGGAAVGALLGFAVVGGDTSDLNGLAPFLYGVSGGLVGGVGGILWGAAEGSPAGRWNRVYGSPGAGPPVGTQPDDPRPRHGSDLR